MALRAELISIKRLFSQAKDYLNQTVTVAGWVKALRDQKAFAFISLSDGSGFRPLQIVVARDAIENYAEVTAQGFGAALIVTGVFAESPAPGQPYELRAETIRIEGACLPDYPLQPKRQTPEYLRTIAHLRPRTNLLTAVFRVRSEAALSLHRFFSERGFLYVQTPLITASDAEGAGEMFNVTTLDLRQVPLTEEGTVDYAQDFFGQRTSLTVSGQLNAEAFAQTFSKVYTFGPTFRAEHSNTARHAAEFWMLEPEIAFADLEDDMALAEAMLKAVVRDIMARCADELAFFNRFVDKGLLARLTQAADASFAKITYTQAIELLSGAGRAFKYPVKWGMDIQTEHERYLAEEIYKGPVFVTDYPKEIKAFYMRLNDDGKTVAAMDCLLPGIGEIIGGSQREERLERLERRMAELGLRAEDYSWYLDLRRYGSTRHAGFGLGFERLVMYLTGVANIRDVCAFPRTAGSAGF